MLCFDIEKPVLYIFYANSDTYLKLSTNSWNIKHNLFNKKNLLYGNKTMRETNFNFTKTF